MNLKFVSELIQIASLRFIEALEGSKITVSKMQSSCLIKITKRSRIDVK